ncbi:MAG: hypothetical protein ACRD2G_01525 [Terriglobia bacterium]
MVGDSEVMAQTLPLKSYRLGQFGFYRKCDRPPVLDGGASRSTGLSILTAEAADPQGEHLSNSQDSENQTPMCIVKDVFISRA